MKKSLGHQLKSDVPDSFFIEFDGTNKLDALANYLRTLVFTKL